jgi:hypothetical protein
MYTRADIFTGGADVYVDNQNIGWTRGGVRIRVNKSMWFRPSFSGLGADSVVKQSEEFYISTVLVESTIGNLRKAWGIYEGVAELSGSSDRQRLDFGGSTGIWAHSLKFIARSRTLAIGFYKVVAVDFGEITYGKNGDASIPVTFRALLDTTRAVGQQIGYFESSPYLGERALVGRTTVRQLGTRNLVSKVYAIARWMQKNLVARMTVLLASTSSVVSRTTVRKTTGRALVSRVASRTSGSTSFVSRVTVRNFASRTFTCRIKIPI